LDQIRQAEAEVARRIALARENAEHTLAQAKSQARSLVEEAARSGKNEGQALYREILARAEEEAKAILANAKSCGEDLQRRGGERIEMAVQYILDLVLDLGVEERVK
jgi:ATP synthase H subunit